MRVRQGTINEFTSIKPLVPLRRNITAQKSIIKEPRILGIWKNWFNKAPLPAKIMEALEIKYRVVITPVNFPNMFGLISFMASL